MYLKNIFTKRNGYFLVIFVTAAVFGFDYNILHGFFPHFAPTKNMSALVTGLLYSEYEVVILIFFPIAGQLAPIMGGEKLLFFRTLLLGVSTIFFGLAYFVPAGLPFILTTFGTRAIGSVGAAFGFVVNPAIIATLADKDNVCTLIGSMESVLATGIMLGPTVGSILFKYGGYICPFAVVGATLVVLAVIIISTFPNFKSTNIVEGQLSIFITSSTFWVNTFALVMVNFTIGFQSACFFLYCKDMFNMSPLMSSLAFLGDGLAFAVTSPLVGLLNDAYPFFLPHSIRLGLLISAISLIFSGPMPFMGIKPHIAISVTSTIVFGIGDAFVFAPVFTQLLKVALNLGLPDDFKTYSIVSSCHGFFGILALALGPTVGVLMYRKLGYGYACGVIALFMMLAIFVLVIIESFKRLRGDDRNPNCIANYSKTASGRMHVYDYKAVISRKLNPNIKSNIEHDQRAQRDDESQSLLAEINEEENEKRRLN